MRLQERSIGNILWHTRHDWLDINNYSMKTSSNRKLTLVNLKLHCMQSASFFILSRDNRGSSKSSFPNSSWADCGIDWKGTSRMAGPFDPLAPLLPVQPALEVPLAAAWVCSKTSGFGLFDISVVSGLGVLTDGFSINPMIGDSGADRLVPSELLDTQLRKSWICSFSHAGRCWILTKQDSE